MARWCGVRVETFSLGFGPKLLKYKKGDTLYCLSLLPLGGYVKMFGEQLGGKACLKGSKNGDFCTKVFPKNWPLHLVVL